MTRLRRIRRSLDAVIARTRFERDMREELLSHLDHRADDLMAAGVPRDEALRRARVEFGALESYKERCRDVRGFARLRFAHGFTGDVKLAARRLAATPLFATFAVLSLALGVGVTSAVYSVVDGILWRELGVLQPETVAFVMAPDREQLRPRWVVSRPDFDDLRAAQTAFTRMAATVAIYPGVATADTTEVLQAEAVDGSYFAVLGVSPWLGRTIESHDDASAAPVAVLSHTLWRTRFAADPNVTGRLVRLSGRTFEIVGVAPKSFAGAFAGTAGSVVWVPLATAEWFWPPSKTPERDLRRLTVLGRLKPGVTAAHASAELATIADRLDASYPGKNAEQPALSRRGWSARSLADINARHNPMRRFGLMVVALVALVLVVACTNLANLMLARGTTRSQEFAVRRALGASRWRLVREQSAESILLATAGGAASYVVLQGLIYVLNVEIPMAPNWRVSVQPEVSGAAVAVAAAALLLSLVVFGVEPALQLTRSADVREHLAAGGGGTGAPRTRRQRSLLRWQVAISAGFFIVASMCVRYLATEARHDPGVDLDRLGIAVMGLSQPRWDETRARQTLDRVIADVRGEPGVEAAAVSAGLPFGTAFSPLALLSTPDKPIVEHGQYEDAVLIPASPGFFRATGISLLRGRTIDERDATGAPQVIVLSESTARKLLGTADAIGRELLIRIDLRERGPGAERPAVRSVTVAGIAEDTDTTHFMLRRGNTAYVPFAQLYRPFVSLVVRSRDADAAVAALRTSIRRVDPDLAVEGIGTGRMMLAGPYVFLRGAGIVSLSLGGLTLLLAMVGLYGVQSHIVSHRTREIGVRMSCGASARQIKMMVLKDGYRPVLQGLVIGLFIGISGRAIVRSAFVGTMDILDPWMLATVPVPLVAAAFLACYWPARRAARVDPNVALRHL